MFLNLLNKQFFILLIILASIIILIPKPSNSQALQKEAMSIYCDHDLNRALNIVMEKQNMKIIFHGTAEEINSNASNDIFVFANDNSFLLAFTEINNKNAKFCMLAWPKLMSADPDLELPKLDKRNIPDRKL